MPVYVEGKGQKNGLKIDATALSGAHAKDNAIGRLLHDALLKESSGQTAVYYINKEEAQSYLPASKDLMPWWSVGDGLIHSIRDAGSPVNVAFDEQIQVAPRTLSVHFVTIGER